MRILLLILTFLVMRPALACEGFENSMAALEYAVAQNAPARAQKISHSAALQSVEAVFKAEFSSTDEMTRWAASSTLGGGQVNEMTFDGRKLAVVLRSYTSGVKSSDIAVYAENNGTWSLVKSHPPVWNTWIETRTFRDHIAFHAEGNNETLLTLTPQDLD